MGFFALAVLAVLIYILHRYDAFSAASREPVYIAPQSRLRRVGGNILHCIVLAVVLCLPLLAISTIH